MNHKFARSLTDRRDVEHFLSIVLGTQAEGSVISKIVTSEMCISTIAEKESTLDSDNHRIKYVNDAQRWEMRKKIVDELINKKRPKSDDSLKLGNGGALPRSKSQFKKEAVIIIGLPASGKSTVASHLADSLGATIIDNDFAKRKMPEFEESESYGATIVHEEASAIVLSSSQFRNKVDGFCSLFEKCVEKGQNIVIPKIGHGEKSIENLARLLKEQLRYSVHLVLVALDRRDATLRAMERFVKTKRYVPLGLIFDSYGNEPTLTYYRLKNKQKNIFKSFGKISSNVALGQPFRLVDSTKSTPVKKLSAKVLQK